MIKWIKTTILIRRLMSTNSSNRAAIDEVLNKLIYDVKAVNPLIRVLEQSPDTRLRKYVSMALGRLGDARAIGPLIAALGDSHEVIRMAAAGALTHLGQHEWSRLIRGTGDDWVSLGSSGDARVFVPLVKALADSKEIVRQAAALALGLLGDTRAVAPLVKALTDSEEDVRQAAAGALGLLGDARAVGPLVKILDVNSLHTEFDSSVKIEACFALAELCDEKAVEPLLKTLLNNNGDVRKAAAEALVKLRHPEWSQLIQGDEADHYRLKASLYPYATSIVIKELVQLLGAERRHIRVDAVNRLVKIIESNLSYPIPYREHIKDRITAKHTDKHSDYTADCGRDISFHTDEGLGLKLPVVLRKRDF